MHYVYILRSLSNPTQTYVGYSTDLKERLAAHNRGESTHTSKFMPWELICYHAFANKWTAQEFEHYLKTASGKAFANKRFLTSGD